MLGLELLAPNPLIMRTGFIQLGIIIVMALIAGVKKSSLNNGPWLWAKLNAPLLSLILSEAWAVAAFFLFHTVPKVDDYFVAGIWMAGGTSLAAALIKDASDGSMTATKPADVVAMRQENPSSGGVGS